MIDSSGEDDIGSGNRVAGNGLLVGMKDDIGGDEKKFKARTFPENELKKKKKIVGSNFTVE